MRGRLGGEIESWNILGKELGLSLGDEVLDGIKWILGLLLKHSSVITGRVMEAHCFRVTAHCLSNKEQRGQ